jgi:putative DNA primase/helicase
MEPLHHPPDLVAMLPDREDHAGIDYRPVVPGVDQLLGKSQLARILGDDYHADDLPDFHSRDAQQIACSSLVIEVGELAAVTRSSLEKFKSFMTVRFDTYIPKYEKHPITRPRWCVFILTVNPDGAGYLVDSTGNRRIWPVAVGEIKTAALEKDRDQLFAEALYQLRKGARWWPEGEAEWARLKGEQEKREVEDAWKTEVAKWLEGGWAALVENARKEGREPELLTTTTVATYALDLRLGDIDRRATTRIGVIMKELGYTRERQTGGGRLRFYVR